MSDTFTSPQPYGTYGLPSIADAAAPAPTPEHTVSTTDAFAASRREEQAAQSGGPLATVAFDDKTYKVWRKPPTLMLAELARTGTEDPEAVGVLAEFFEITMGKDEYRRFRTAVYTSDLPDVDEAMTDVMSEIVEKTLGRPTE